jgi:predicted ATP-dependent protease
MSMAWRDEDFELHHARMLATLAREPAFARWINGAVARLIEQASRLAGDQQKLTARDRMLRDVLMEADSLGCC